MAGNETKNETLKRRLKAARTLAGLEQRQVAALLGCSRSAVAAWEQGKSEPPATYFVRWARICGVELDWLADGLNTEAAPIRIGAASVVRPEGLEPPTFCSVVWAPYVAAFALIRLASRV